MKKYLMFLSFMLAISVLFSSCSGEDETTVQTEKESEENIYFKEEGSADEVTDIVTDTAVDTDSGAVEDSIVEEAEVLILCCTDDSAMVSKKTVGGKYGGELQGMLLSLKKTGETSNGISDEDPENIHDGVCKAPKGTFWIETDGKIYRISTDKKEICTVDTHYGQGEVLTYSGELTAYLKEIWSYYPRNTLYGTYTNGNIELKRVFEDEGTLELGLKGLEINSDISPDDDANSITVTITSDEDVTVKVEAVPQYGTGEFAKISSKTVTLEKGLPKEVKLTFGGWSDKPYELNVIADTARIHLMINN